MTRDIYAVAADTSLETAARLLASRHISGAPVVNHHGKPIGVVSMVDLVDPDRSHSERDGYPLYYAVGNGSALELGDDVAVGEGQVADVMSPFVLSISANAAIDDAARTMLSDGVHRLLVVAGDQLVGIVTSSDLLRGFLGERAVRSAPV